MKGLNQTKTTESSISLMADLEDCGGTLNHVSNGGYGWLWCNPNSRNDADHEH